MKTRTLLVDSSFLFKRSVFGAKHVHTTKFGHIGGLYSFLTTLRKLIKEHRINKVVLVWDGEQGGYYRHLIDPAYKATRKNKKWYEKIELSESEIKRESNKEESILKQKKRIQAYAEELFLRQIEVDKIEADDIIASYTERYNETEDIFLYTNDRDFIQTLKNNITIIFGNKEDPITWQNFFFQFHYHHTNSLAMKVICGDTSDNLVGIKGISEPTLLKHFPDLKYKTISVREICSMADDINKQRVDEKKKPLKVFENLLSPEGIKTLKLNYKLMNLSEPFLNDEAIVELGQLDMPLSDEDRNSRNLLDMMKEDDFLTVFGGGFATYVKPFYSVIKNEKNILKDFLKNN